MSRGRPQQPMRPTNFPRPTEEDYAAKAPRARRRRERKADRLAMKEEARRWPFGPGTDESD